MTIAVNEFLDTNGFIRTDLLDKEASKIADELSKTNLSTHQVRKFYDEVKHYKARIDKENNLPEMMPLIVMLKSKASYVFNKEKDRKKKDGLKLLYDFICNGVGQVKDDNLELQKKKFDAFCLFFEAVYGFANLKKN